MVNAEKAGYYTIVSVGTVNDFEEKLKFEGKSWNDVVDLQEKPGGSLLKQALASGKFDIARKLIDAGAEVNLVDADGYNEFQALAPRLHEQGALEFANELLDRGVSVDQVEKKFGNTTMFTLLMEALRKPNTELDAFISRALEQFSEWDLENKRGLSVRWLITERGSAQQRAQLAELAG